MFRVHQCACLITTVSLVSFGCMDHESSALDHAARAIVLQSVADEISAVRGWTVEWPHIRATVDVVGPAKQFGVIVLRRRVRLETADDRIRAAKYIDVRPVGQLELWDALGGVEVPIETLRSSVAPPSS